MKKVSSGLVAGQIGSGKTSYVKWLLSVAPRAVVLDKIEEYEAGTPAYSFAEFAALYGKLRRADFQITIRSASDSDQLRSLGLLYATQRAEELPPVLVVMEEASYYSSNRQIPEVVQEVATKGRHALLSVLYLVQHDTQIHPLIRQNIRWLVAFRQRKPGPDIRGAFTREELTRIRDLADYSPPLGAPVYGEHYLTDPPEFDVRAELARILTLEGNGKG